MAKINAINNKSGSLTTDPGASGDSFIQFNINATGEFRIGVDDTDSNKFKISQGSALGTNDRFEITANGEGTIDSQPSFFAFAAAGIVNVTGDGTVYTQVFANERFDVGGDFSSTTFTAPVTGKYFLSTAIRSQQVTDAHTSGELRIVTSNNTFYLYRGTFDQAMLGATQVIQPRLQVIADMDASDTATVEIVWSNSTKTVDIGGDASATLTYFSGNLIC